MRRFINPAHVPSVPKSWRTTHNNQVYRVPWNSGVPWESFYSQVRAFTERNSLPVPSEAEVEDMICGQLASGWCTSDVNYHRPPQIARKGCSACGRR